MKNIVIKNFEVIRPPITFTQSESLEFLTKAHIKADETVDHHRIELLIKRFGLKPTQIRSRGLESKEMCSDVNSIYELTRFFGERTTQVFKDFFKNTSTPPSHLIHVTCTGYIAPSPAQLLVQHKEWTEKTKVTHAYHMGCYASIPSIRMAEGFIHSGDKSVDITHTEMCSIHLNAKDHSPEQLVVQSLFADGYIKYTAALDNSEGNGLRVKAIKEKIIPDSEKDMTWQPADWGMKMSLSREVPEKIVNHLKGFIQNLCIEAGIDFEIIKKTAIFAVHPGGPKIIDSVQSSMELSDEQVASSKKILFNYGNMSSATLPHVWKDVLEKGTQGQLVISLAFGPGLTIFGAVFEIV